MHLRHRQTDRQTDASIVAQVRDVYITSHTKTLRASVQNLMSVALAIYIF